MSHLYTATVSWTSEAESHRSGRYSRAHEWRFDGGAVVPASAAPAVPGADPTAVDPEEALVAAVSSCHMLFFLAFARQKDLIVTAYDDEAEGVMTPNDAGKLYISTVTLRPRLTVEGEADPAIVAECHRRAHDECYIAHSIKADVRVEPR